MRILRIKLGSLSPTPAFFLERYLEIRISGATLPGGRGKLTGGGEVSSPGRSCDSVCGVCVCVCWGLNDPFTGVAWDYRKTHTFTLYSQQWQNYSYAVAMEIILCLRVSTTCRTVLKGQDTALVRTTVLSEGAG